MSQQKIFQFLKAGLVAALLALSGFADVKTGYEISVFPLYALPIGFAVWFFGMRGGCVLAGASTLIWIWADAAAGHVYSKPWIAYLNAGTRLLFFLLVVIAAGQALRALRRSRDQWNSLSQTLPVCADCGKVRDHEGYWWDFQAYLRQYVDAMIRAKLCPDCARKAYAETSEPPASHPQ